MTSPTPEPTGPLPAAQDFYRLRREGIGHVQDAGSDRWTDYNTHDPGISILEGLAYAITELGYRTGFPIEDILASGATAGPGGEPYPDQPFTTARHILTVNPVTAEDLRRLLIDVDQVRNAWVQCKACACDTPLLAWCEDNELVLADDPAQRTDPTTEITRITPRGLYDVRLELEADPALGDLNDRKIVRRRSVEVDGQLRPWTVEVRFPAWPLARRRERQALAADDRPIQRLTVAGPHKTTTGVTRVSDEELRRNWSDVFYVDVDIELADGSMVAIENASVRLFGDGAVRRHTTSAAVTDWLEETSAEGFVEPYRRKLALIARATAAARSVLEAHRNLDEDLCHLDLVEIDDIAVCAEVEVEPTADIELVQAQIWFEIERYLDPPVDFWSLGELLAQDERVETIFNGPELGNGFLTADGMAASDLRLELRVSDLINRLSGIPGVVSLANVLLTAYDGSGNPVSGTVEQAWVLSVPAGHRTRLHHALSRLSFTSRGLPFRPRLDEAEATLVQLRGRTGRPKLRGTDLDLAVPPGTRRGLEAYHPVQHSFPLTYGIGPAGLPSTATTQRRAQARQLKGYLMVYEQLLRNGYAQLAHVGDLFSLDPAIDRTYFSSLFDDPPIVGYEDLVDGLDAAALQRLVESPTEFRDRRNRFLDHLLARFGESFADYAMALTDLDGQARAATELIHNKITFLRALPRLGHDRGRARNRALPCDPGNVSGLQQRVNLLLGLPDWVIAYRAERTSAASGYTHRLRVEEPGGPVATFAVAAPVGAALEALIADRGLDTAAVTEWAIVDADGHLTLTSVAAGAPVSEVLPDTDPQGADLRRELAAARRRLLAQLVLRERYAITASGSRWMLTVEDGTGHSLGETVVTFPTRRLASDHIAVLATWAAHQRAIVVEHLLLRPKFPGDALYPVCSDGSDCASGCADADPYSFRLTYVMPGWTAPFNTNVTMRAYADRTIQEQTPSLLLGKTCWVGNEGYVVDPCDPMIDRLAAVLADQVDSACTCAAEIYAAYGATFEAWFATQALTVDPPDVLAGTLAGVFAEVDLTAVSCSAALDPDLRTRLEAELIEHFVDLARHGFQFERFEDAWCAWSDAEAAMDWTQERLQDTVVELLDAARTSAVEEGALCRCAATILASFGTAFRRWLEGKIAAGAAPDALTDFDPPTPTLCPGLSVAPGVTATIRDHLGLRYASYTQVSYRLHILLHRLGELRNTYPRATLHDCDAGSDVNPVRLGQTALGSN